MRTIKISLLILLLGVLQVQAIKGTETNTKACLDNARKAMNHDLTAMHAALLQAEISAGADTTYTAEIIKWKGVWAMLSGMPAEAHWFFDQAIHLAQEYRQEEMRMSCMNNLGLLFQEEGKLREAESLFSQSLAYSRLHSDVEGLACAYGNLGNIQQLMGYPKIALFYHYLSGCYDAKVGKMDDVMTSVLNSGAILVSMNYYQIGMSLYQAVCFYARLKQDDLLLSRVLNNMGFACLLMESYSLAESYYRESLLIREKRHDLYGLAYTLSGMAELYRKLGKWEKSNELLFSALKIREEIQDDHGIASSLWQIAENLRMADKYQEALWYLQNSQLLSKRDGDSPQMEDNNLSLAYCFLKLGDLDEAQRIYLQSNHKVQFLNSLHPLDFLNDTAPEPNGDLDVVPKISSLGNSTLLLLCSLFLGICLGLLISRIWRTRQQYSSITNEGG